jgi:hypothetical protein
MRKLLLGSALAAVLTVGVPGLSFASTLTPVTPDVHLTMTGTIQVQNENPLSNQAPHDEEDDDDNGNNGGE